MTIRRAATLLLAAASGAAPAAAQPTLRDQVRQFRERNEAAVVRELTQFLARPNVASNIADIRANAALLRSMMERRGIRTQLLEVDDAPPAVYGELSTPGATKTVALYAHYDGQPVDPAKWRSDPWQPTLRRRPEDAGVIDFAALPNGPLDPESRIYARSASDDKAPIVAMLWALDALTAQRVDRSVNLKFFFEGEEEAGSANLRKILVKYHDLLRADFWIFADGPVHQTRAPQVVFGVRGVIGVNLTIYGPYRPLHSGHYGNWAPNPNVMMVDLLASMRDAEGRITIAGYYDDVRPLDARDQAAFRAMPPVEEQLVGELRLGRTEGAPHTLAEQIALPALNLSGLSGGRTGSNGANVIVPESQAYLDLRLVPDQRVARVRELVEKHLQSRGFHIVAEEPDSATRRNYPKVIRVVWTGGYPAARTSAETAGARALIAAADRILGRPIIRVPTLGGSVDLAGFVEVLGAPFALLPIVNHDNNQHAENENLRLANLWDGIELFAGVLAWMGREWQPVP